MEANIEKTKFYAEIEKHLKGKNGLIAVTKGNSKLQKSFGNGNKFNFTLQDVLAHANSVEAFIQALPSKGFGSGSVLIFRKTHGNTTAYVSETELNFSEPQQQLSGPTPTTNSNPQQTTEPMEQPKTPSATPATAAMGFTQVPQYELITLKVKEERFADLVEKLAKAEKERDKAESDYRMEREKSFTLERKLETIEEKHELKLEREINNKKGFLETESGQALAGAAISNLDKILLAIKPQSASAVGMGNPLASLSQQKQAFFEALKEMPDEILPYLQKAAELFLNDDEFSAGFTASYMQPN
jgi:hypothetical protein